MTRALAAVLALGAGGCFAAGALSATTYTTLACEACRLPVVATGQVIQIDLDWPCSDEQESDGTCDEMVRATAECAGAPCTQEYSGLGGGHGILRVRASATGTLTLNVSYTDGLQTRSETFGPVRVVAPDRVELACWARAPGETEYRRCDAGVRAGDDVRVDLLALGGDARLDTRPDVEIDGTVLPPGTREDKLPWFCYPALATPDGPGPATTCVAYDLAAGPHTIRARLADLASELTLDAQAP